MSRRSIGLAGIPFVALSALLFFLVTDSTAEALAPALVAIAMALAIFAVNFSFVAFQLAPYRQLRGGPSKRHVAAGVALISVALTPLFGTACSTTTTGQIAVIVTPMLAYGCAVLGCAGTRGGRAQTFPR